MPAWVFDEDALLAEDGSAHRPGCPELDGAGETVLLRAGELFTRPSAPQECHKCEPWLDMRLAPSDPPPRALD